MDGIDVDTRFLLKFKSLGKDRCELSVEDATSTTTGQVERNK